MTDTTAPAADGPALLVLVRHGQSERNVAKPDNRFFLDDEARQSVRGVADHRIALTAEGRRQALETGVALRARYGVFDRVYHSGYRRTIETADGVLSAYSAGERAAMPVQHELFIRERDAGHAYDMTDSEALAAFPWLQDYWQTHGPFFARPPGGESLAEVCGRVHTFLDELAATQAGRRLLVVTHAGTLRCFRSVLEGWTYEEAERRFTPELIPHCSVTWYGCDAPAGRPVLGAACEVFWTPGG
jgi:broad specificity phosphatase PhoE